MLSPRGRQFNGFKYGGQSIIPVQYQIHCKSNLFFWPVISQVTTDRLFKAGSMLTLGKNFIPNVSVFILFLHLRFFQNVGNTNCYFIQTRYLKKYFQASTIVLNEPGPLLSPKKERKKTPVN